MRLIYAEFQDNSITSVHSRHSPAPARSRSSPFQQESSFSGEADADKEALQQLELARRNNTTPDKGRVRVRRWVEGQQLCRQED
ncbi:hypothetical protein OUZ56_017531 [Daphnia magna]|uniref:Uncharacterized protein n=1 Tax=Daphnia magna TaxID=35525 RepID=A0ABR0AT54_9CRUS|nr:hypothetical protein OUZ56_017499 [Daphnia magna]KAK4028251.1 hypothetical protein OUZ56_017531 [Daphnia magna]